MNPCRIAFFIYKEGSRTLRTPYGDFDLTNVEKLPKRLKNIIEFEGKKIKILKCAMNAVANTLLQNRRWLLFAPNVRTFFTGTKIAIMCLKTENARCVFGTEAKVNISKV